MARWKWAFTPRDQSPLENPSLLYLQGVATKMITWNRGANYFRYYYEK
jgi:hypothetical protein